MHLSFSLTKLPDPRQNAWVIFLRLLVRMPQSTLKSIVRMQLVSLR